MLAPARPSQGPARSVAARPERTFFLILSSTALPALLATVLAAALGLTLAGRMRPAEGARRPEPTLVTLEPRPFDHRLDGEYWKHGLEVDAPMKTITLPAPLTIMAYPVSARDYDACVADGVCAPREPGNVPADPAADNPATGVSHDDALAYAGWLSRRTGNRYDLPSDAEWAFAAGERFVDDALGIDPDSRNPALRWLADYEREARRKASRNPAPRPLGSGGANGAGLYDLSGNVWEWTSTCHRKVVIGAAAREGGEDRACGVYVVEGRHRAPISSFVREAKGGGCAVGAPPDNLGFRLVRRPGRLSQLAAWLRQMFAG